MIVSRLVSGLGNQLFQYAIGRQLSLHHRVPLKLDTGFFETQTLRSFALDNYNIQAKIASKKEVDDMLYWQNNPGLIAKFYRKVQRMLPRAKQHYFKELEWWSYDPDLLKVSSKVYLDGYWQHYKYYLNISPGILNEITLKKNVEGAVSMEKNIMQDHSSVSIHIRRGDYITDTLMGMLKLEYYKDAVDYMNAKLNNPSYYIFSDDLNWAKDNLKINRSVTYIDLEAGSKYDYVELDLMSKCYHNIIANSSFSWWGAFLNRNPDKIVIAPRNWVVRPEINARIQLQFPSWIKM